MSAERFLDSNVLIYAFSTDEPRASRAAGELARGGSISVQVLNEFAAVCRGKLRLAWLDVHERISVIRDLVEHPAAITDDIHQHALHIAEARNLAIYDAQIVASALAAGCTSLITEDMQDGAIIEGLRISNPFR